MADTLALVGFCGSRSLDSKWQDLVARVVSAVARNGRGVAVGCARGADAMALRACFTESWGLRAPFLRVFAAFGPSGKGAWEQSAVKLVTQVSRLPMAANVANNGRRIVVNWWAGGEPSVSLVSRLKQRSGAMVQAIAASGQGRGLVAFVCGGPSASPGTWRTVRLAVKRGVPVVVFGCGCQVSNFPSLGKGRWVRAGKGLWAAGWRWMPARSLEASTDDDNTAAYAQYAAQARRRQAAGQHQPTGGEQKSQRRHIPHKARHPEEREDEHVGLIEGILSSLLGWKKLPPGRRSKPLHRRYFSPFWELLS